MTNTKPARRIANCSATVALFTSGDAAMMIYGGWEVLAMVDLKEQGKLFNWRDRAASVFRSSLHMFGLARLCDSERTTAATGSLTRFIYSRSVAARGITAVQDAFGVYYARLLAGAVLAGLPVALAFLLFQRRVTQAITLSAGIKG